MEPAGSPRRDFPRLTATLKVTFEFVRWNETDPEVGPHGVETATHDVSATGIGLFQVPTLTPALTDKLLKGFKKVRLTLVLGETTRLHLFGRLVWASGQTLESERAGFSFIDIPETSFRLMQDYVNARLPKGPTE